ncbi:MAG TPA: hypothetical protein VJM49_21230 [Acidimicrobiales bacterium]|nr:hypothetical protein [Acidimicrobiales bacterium]
MQTERPQRLDRVAPEQAIARLDLRQISLVALYDGLDVADRQRFGAERRVAEVAAAEALRTAATRDERSPAEVARAFFGLYFVFPNLGLAGPYFGGDVRPLKETAWLAAYDAIRSGVCVRAEFHARLWHHVCDEDRRARAAGQYVLDRSLHSVPPSASPLAVERHHRRIDALLTGGECVPALLAGWAIERHPGRLDELATAEVRHKHGLLEQRHMAALLGMRPNTLAQSLKRFRARLGEEMRMIWDIERTVANDEDEDR